MDMEAHLRSQQTVENGPTARELTDELGYILAYLWACANEKVERLQTGPFSSEDFYTWTLATKHQYLGWTPSLDQLACGSEVHTADTVTTASSVQDRTAPGRNAIVRAKEENRSDTERYYRNPFMVIEPENRTMLLHASERYRANDTDEDGHSL